MSLPIVLRSVAASEVRGTIRWYDEQREGLGDNFARAVFETLELIGEMPELHQVIEPARTIRRALLRRFPYAVYYITETERIVVLAVLHVARDPSSWHERE